MSSWDSRGSHQPSSQPVSSGQGRAGTFEVLEPETQRPAALQQRGPHGGDSSRGPRHLVVLVNGVFGNAGNWSVVRAQLAEQLDGEDTLLHVSAVNQYRETFDGIEKCGARLAAEVGSIVESHPGLERISLLCHSMGGLIGRYMAGSMFDPASGTICGLRPCHYISIATPHLGCTVAPGPAQVPLVGWAGSVPVLGGGLRAAAAWAAGAFAHAVYRRSGQQLFLADAGGGGACGEPLLLRMTRDVPSEGYFYSALAAFETRTAYANRGGDYNVGWANASLRALSQLPQLPGKGKGVIREDPPEAAWQPQGAWARLSGSAASTECGHAGEDRLITVGEVLRAPAPSQLAQSVMTQSGEHTALEGAPELASQAGPPQQGQPRRLGGAARAEQGPAASGSRTQAAEAPCTGAYVEEILAQLQRIPWRRVDVCFGQSMLPFLSHAHIQVTRSWINWEGVATAKHIALHLVALEGARGEQRYAPVSR